MKDKAKLLKDVGRQATTSVFIHHCVAPRLLMAPEDALYCAKFAALLHEVGVPGFSSIQFFDKVPREICAVLNSVTRSEATNLGVFLLETLSLLGRWRQSGKVYDREVRFMPRHCIIPCIHRCAVPAAAPGCKQSGVLHEAYGPEEQPLLLQRLPACVQQVARQARRCVCCRPAIS